MHLGDLLHTVRDFLNAYGNVGIFIVMVIENLGVPFPTELGFIAGQAMVNNGQTSYEVVFLVALAGKTVGSIITYYIGTRFAKKIKKITKENSRLKEGQKMFVAWMKRYGSFAVFISRLVGYARPWSSYFAGIGEIGFWPFIFYNVTGSAIIIAISMVVLGSIVELWKRFVNLRPLIIILLIASFVGFWVYLGIRSLIKKRKAVS